MHLKKQSSPARRHEIIVSSFVVFFSNFTLCLTNVASGLFRQENPKKKKGLCHNIIQLYNFIHISDVVTNHFCQ